MAREQAAPLKPKEPILKPVALFLLLLLTFLALPHGSAAQSSSPVPQILGSDHRRFVKDGAPWFPLGFYGAALNMTNGEWDHYTATCQDGGRDVAPPERAARCAFQTFVDRLQANGLNYVRAWANWGAIPVGSTAAEWDYRIVHPYQRSSIPGAIDGGNKFDLDAPINPVYLQLLKDEVDYAASKGVVVQIVLFDGWHVANQAGRDYYKAANNVTSDEKAGHVDWATTADWTNPTHAVAKYQKRLVAAVVGALRNRPNIIWETCNEDQTKNVSTPSTAVSSWDQSIGTEIALADSNPPHLIMPIDLPEHRTVAGYRTPAPSSAESVEAMHNRLRDTQHGWDLPLITDNDCCDPALGDYGDIPREKAWGALTAGAHTNFFIDHIAIVKDLMNNRSDIDRGMREVGNVNRFLTSAGVDLVDMVPSDDKIVGGTGAWAYARPNDEFVVYLRKAGNQAPSVTLSALPNGFVAKWFDPRGSTAPFLATGGPTFTAPTSGDWVLHVKGQPLSICQQPAAASASLGGNVLFQAAACGGVAPLSYRWQYSSNGTSYTNLADGFGVSGSATPSMTVAGVGPSRNGFYRLRVTDSSPGAAQVFSNGAQLIVSTTTTLTLCTNTPGLNVTPGSSGSLSGFACGGSPPYFYRWQISSNGSTWSDLSNVAPYSGVTGPTLSISSIYAGQVGYYRVRITDSATPPAQAISAPAPVTLTATCTPGPNTLCLQNGRFKVEGSFFTGGPEQAAFATSYSNWGGFFWFFSSSNTEVGVKVLQGPASWWVFHGAATDQHYKLTVTDLQTGAQKIYDRAGGNLCGGRDYQAFPLGNLSFAPSGSVASQVGQSPASATASSRPFGNVAGSCVPSATRICQLDGRFQVEIKRGGVPQPGLAINTSTGVYWFYIQDNAEVFIKVLDARAINHRYWVYWGSMSDQEFDIVVTDTVTGAFKTYHNALGTYCGGGDTDAFPE